MNTENNHEIKHETEIEIKEWCERRIAETKIDTGYYKKVKEMMEDIIGEGVDNS